MTSRGASRDLQTSVSLRICRAGMILRVRPRAVHIETALRLPLEYLHNALSSSFLVGLCGNRMIFCAIHLHYICLYVLKAWLGLVSRLNCSEHTDSYKINKKLLSQVLEDHEVKYALKK